MKSLLVVLLLVFAGTAFADVADDFAGVQTQIEESLLDAIGGHDGSRDAASLRAASAVFEKNLTDPAAKAAWQWLPETAPAELCGTMQARAQHVLALEMLAQQRAGNIDAAKEWRALITLPKHASAVEGALALQAPGAGKNPALTELLAKEYIGWETTRIREKLDNLRRSVDARHASPELAAARLAEIRALADFPAEILQLARVHESNAPAADSLASLAQGGDWRGFSTAYAGWRTQLESTLPNLLTPEEVARRERLLLKLVQLVPKEYKAGVRDGVVVVPLEYREAQSFLIQAEQLVNELSASWRTSRASAYETHGATLRAQLDAAEAAIAAKAPADALEDAVKAAGKTLESGFGLSLQRVGVNIVDETLLDVRTALTASLAAAHAGRWADAESARLDAYTSFDTNIETRVLPRAPELAMRTERSFLEGIKTALDRRLRGAELEAVYQRTLADLAECQALLKVAVSPTTIAFTAATVVMREGLEAVVILAAILAGLRGVEHARQRRGLIRGAWVAVAVSGLTFWLSRTVITSLINYGEKLEAVISILAVCVLLLVTNWVFHKVYWVQWNTKLRHLTSAVKTAGAHRWEWLSLIGVGFLTIYREGFETTLFLQSLMLEGGVRATSIGFGIGLAFIAAIGFAVFKVGAKLPYRKMLVITGVLVVSILITFLGSSVRLFQTVGWMPIHPITWLHIPSWMGLWFGLYPSWEGMLIPPAGLLYVGGAWAYTKLAARAKRRAQAAAEAAANEQPEGLHPVAARLGVSSHG